MYILGRRITHPCDEITVSLSIEIRGLSEQLFGNSLLKSIEESLKFRERDLMGVLCRLIVQVSVDGSSGT